MVTAVVIGVVVLGVGFILNAATSRKRTDHSYGSRQSIAQVRRNERAINDRDFLRQSHSRRR